MVTLLGKIIDGTGNKTMGGVRCEVLNELMDAVILWACKDRK
jgi:hypothetical protein